MRNISLEGLEVLGSGGFATVYKLNDEEIVKVFDMSITEEEIEEKKRIADTLAEYGIPAMRVSEVVRAGGSYGLIGEFLASDTVGKAVNKDPSSAEKYGRRMGKLLRQMHATEVPEGTIPSMKDRMLERIDFMERECHTKHSIAEAMRDCVNSLPDNNKIIHCDFHEGNVMLRGDEPVLIDTDEMCTGSAYYDLGNLYINHDLLVGTPEIREKTVGMDMKECRLMRKYIMREYYNGAGSRTVKEEKRISLMICMLLVGLTPARLGPDNMYLDRKNMWFINHIAQPVFFRMWMRIRNTMKDEHAEKYRTDQ